MSIVAEGDLSLLEESMEELYEHASCGYLTFSDRGLILKANQTFLSWIGFDQSEIISRKNLQDLLPMGGKVFLQTHIHPLLNMQGYANEIFFEFVSQSKKRIPVLTSIRKRSSEDGSRYVYKMTLFNVTDRKSYERELIVERDKAKRAVEAKADFLSMMSHEIRTPMNAVLGIANLLESTALDDRQSEYLNLLKSSAETLMGLLNSILDFSKIESGKDAAQPKPVDLHKLVWSSVRSLEGRAIEKKLPIRVTFAGNPPQGIVTDPIKLVQILNNLLGNAIKFTQTGSIDLVVTCLNQFQSRCVLKFEVIDTGIGIASDRLQLIFEEFAQADSDISLKYGGSGLGLAISSKLAELLGGKLEVSSTYHKGSTFSFTLSLSVAELPSESSSLTSRKVKDLADLSGLTVLVADDNAANIFVLERLLQSWSVAYKIAQNGLEVLQALEGSHFDLLLLDLRMPVMDGFETARRIREDSRRFIRDMPILAFSASSESDSHFKANLKDFNDSIGKPFRPEDLAQKLSMYKPKVLKTSSKSQSCVQMLDLQQPSPKASEALFTLQYYLDSLDNEHEAVAEIVALVIESLEKATRAFHEAIENRSSKDFEFVAHRIQASLEMLKARPLQKAIGNARLALETHADEEAIGVPLDLEFKRLIAGLRHANTRE